jgi:hypothetical protein
MDLLQLAIEKEGSIDVIERLAKLQLEIQDRDDKVRFTEAMSSFKDEVPKIIRTRIIRDKDGHEKYKAVALEDVADPLMKALLKHRITYRFKTDVLENGHIKVTCFLRLEGTAYEEQGSTLAAPPDLSGGKDTLKGVGSTTSYLEKYTLLASCGVHVYGSDPESRPQAGAKPEDLMDESAVMDYASSIEEATTVKELETAYFKARDAAKTDQRAAKYFAECKNKRYRELTKGTK